jgi:hypothetical protein
MNTVIRVLVYQGNEKFLESSITKRAVIGLRDVGGGCSITEYFLAGPIPYVSSVEKLADVLFQKPEKDESAKEETLR